MKHLLQRIGAVLFGTVMVTGLAVTPAFADTGGGCWDNAHDGTCISVRSGTTNPLVSDYYLHTLANGEYKAEVYVLYNYSSGPCTQENGANSIYKGTVSPVWIGHSPVFTTNKPSGANCARTHVIYRKSSGTWITDNYSPWERW